MRHIKDQSEGVLKIMIDIEQDFDYEHIETKHADLVITIYNSKDIYKIKVIIVYMSVINKEETKKAIKT